MDIIDFFTDVGKNDMQYLLTNPRAKYTAKKEKLISAWIQYLFMITIPKV